MSLNARSIKQESKFKAPEALDIGTYPARVVQVVALGVQKQDPYQGQEKAPKPEIYVTYELLDEFLVGEDGEELTDKPRWLSETFTMNSLESDLAKSTKRYMALDPSLTHDGDWSQMIGAPCLVTITQNEGKGKNAGRTFNNISSVQTMRTKEADKAPALVNEGKVFDIDEPDMDVFLSLPTFLQDKMKANLDFGGSALEKAIAGHTDGSGDKGSQKEEKGTQESSQEASEGPTDDGDDW